MTKEWQLIEGRLDSSHEFCGAAYECSQCGKSRALHLHTGFVPSPSPGRLGQDANGRFLTDPHVRFKGPHPRFTKAGRYIAIRAEEFGQKGRKAMGV